MVAFGEAKWKKLSQVATSENRQKGTQQVARQENNPLSKDPIVGFWLAIQDDLEQSTLEVDVYCDGTKLQRCSIILPRKNNNKILFKNFLAKEGDKKISVHSRPSEMFL